MPVGTLAQQRARLRVLVGRANQTALISDALLDECLNESLRVVNQRSPQVGVASFPTVADQHVYSVTLPAGAYNVRKVFWYGERPDFVTETFCDIYRPFWKLLNEQGSVVLEDPSVIFAMYQKRQLLERFVTTGTQIESPNIVYLIPPPTVVANVFYTYSKRRFSTVEDVDDSHATAYNEYAKHLLHTALATGAGGVTSVKSEAGITMTTRASTAHEEASKVAYRKFESSLPPMTPFRAWAG
jgi:hypothetical protein